MELLGLHLVRDLNTNLTTHGHSSFTHGMQGGACAVVPWTVTTAPSVQPPGAPCL